MGEIKKRGASRGRLGGGTGKAGTLASEVRMTEGNGDKWSESDRTPLSNWTLSDFTAQCRTSHPAPEHEL